MKEDVFIWYARTCKVMWCMTIEFAGIILVAQNIVFRKYTSNVEFAMML